jgi:hypothetical protein
MAKSERAAVNFSADARFVEPLDHRLGNRLLRLGIKKWEEQERDRTKAWRRRDRTRMFAALSKRSCSAPPADSLCMRIEGRHSALLLPLPPL